MVKNRMQILNILATIESSKYEVLQREAYLLFAMKRVKGINKPDAPKELGKTYNAFEIMEVDNVYSEEEPAIKNRSHNIR